jgi:hypothetical protein
MTSKPLHQAVSAPSMMYLLCLLDGEVTEFSAHAILAVPRALNRTVHVPNYCTSRMPLPSETLSALTQNPQRLALPRVVIRRADFERGVVLTLTRFGAVGGPAAFIHLAGSVSSRAFAAAMQTS